MTREFYYPADAVVEKLDSPVAEIHRYGTDERPCVAMFGGKRSKPDNHFIYRSLEAREAAIEKYLEGLRSSEAYRAERRSTAKGGHTLVVGDVLYASWGYDQTNVDFYEVVEVPSKCFVILQHIQNRHAFGSETGGPSERVMPAIGSPAHGWWDENGCSKQGPAPTIRRKASRDNYVTIDDSRHAGKWDGQSLHQTGAMFGH
jgi:hypothetical protein